MNRREAVQYISLLLGGTILGAEAFIGCKSGPDDNITITDEDVAYWNEVAETILPATKTPGAKAAKVGEHMRVMVNDCYEKKDQKVFKDGMKKINELSKEAYSDDFVKVKPEQRQELLIKLDNEQKEAMKNMKPGQDKHYFRLIKELTLLGYFTSEIGCTVARRFIETPGKWDACVPYTKGDKAWA